MPRYHKHGLGVGRQPIDPTALMPCIYIKFLSQEKRYWASTTLPANRTQAYNINIRRRRFSFVKITGAANPLSWNGWEYKYACDAHLSRINVTKLCIKLSQMGAFPYARLPTVLVSNSKTSSVKQCKKWVRQDGMICCNKMTKISCFYCQERCRFRSLY